MRRHQPNRVTRDIFGQNRGLECSGAICRAACKIFGTLSSFLDFVAIGTRAKKRGKNTERSGVESWCFDVCSSGRSRTTKQTTGVARGLPIRVYGVARRYRK